MGGCPRRICCCSAFGQPPSGADPDGAVVNPVRLHVMLDEPFGALGDGSLQRLQPRSDVVVRIDRLADVVQKGRQQQFFVPGAGIAGQFEHLQAVIQRIPFRMPFARLLHLLQRQQQRAVDGETVDDIFGVDQRLFD